MDRIDPRRVALHVKDLCQTIGVRLAGTDAEQAAADYCAAAFRAAGAAVAQEPFPVKSRAVTRESLEVRVGGAWRSFSCSLFSSTPGTVGRWIEAPLVFFEAPTEYARSTLEHLRGAAVVHLGCHIETRDHYRRLMAARPAFLMLVDIRYPGATPLADGMFPSYTEDLGAVPTVNVAYQDAWSWRVEGASAARVNVAGGMRDGASQNVIADLPGTDGGGPGLFLGAHHDTQADSVGADDNASGVAGLLELARVLAPVPRRRAIRLISFGAEEQLSVGSATHVRRHRRELADGGILMFNLDSIGSYMGWTELVVNGPPELLGYVRPSFEARDLYVKASEEIMPYADHFPFVATGVPGITMIRANCAAGRFFHHRPDDDPSRVDPHLMARLLDAVAACIADLAARDEVPFARAIPAAQARAVEAFWTDLFGGWSP
jgi:aminopeptidase YwaD